MNSNIIEIGNFSIKWYSVLILLGFGLGFLFVFVNRNKLKLSKQEVIDFLFYTIIFAIIGARLYYCLFNLDYYLKYPVDILKIWEGGLAIHGGIITALIYIFCFSKKHKIKVLEITDLIAVILPLGQTIGRWGNFFNQEAYGVKTSYTFLKSIHLPEFIIKGMHIEGNFYQPTFLYESLSCLIIFIILFIIFKRNKFKIGTITSIYLILYGIERFFVESLITDSLMFLNLRIAQIISILFVIAGILILVVRKFKHDK